MVMAPGSTNGLPCAEMDWLALRRDYSASTDALFSLSSPISGAIRPVARSLPPTVLCRPTAGFQIGPSAAPRSTPVFSGQDGSNISDSSIHQQQHRRACQSLPLRSLLRSTQPALGSPCSTDATLTLLRSLWIRLLLQNAWWKGKVDWWKGRFQGLCGEDSEVPQRKGWLAGQYLFFSSLIPWRLSLVVFA